MVRGAKKQQSQEPQIEVIDLEEERRRLEEELKMYKKSIKIQLYFPSCALFLDNIE
ncbi:hypothetical protein GCM10020331_010760 [Ectobacillus funiculus]